MREAIALKTIFPKQKMSFFDFIHLSSGNILSDCIHAQREKVLLKNISEIFLFRVMQFWGTYKGFKHGEVDRRLHQRFYYPNGLKKGNSEKRSDAEKILYTTAI
jgi:hypothetical protein